jgi:myosin-15
LKNFENGESIQMLILFNKDKYYQDSVEIGSDAEIKWASYLLGLNEHALKQNLTHKITETKEDKVLTPFNIEQALDAR